MKFVLLKEKQEAERKSIEAGGIASFQKFVSDGISPNLLKWKGVEATEKFANSPNTKIVIMGNDSNGLPVILNADAPGDNIMAEFSSVVNAVQCSVDIQKVLKEKNSITLNK